ncbi:3-oxoacyl-[acyl-carrier-protein] synthase III C-terminal domain-containing protein [Streptomyces sp. DSM 44915]|uniref:3-oxoacyl-[acyl-carrier-protein] synthase III C-terminal domain-containing protein n=1 Tax=Streptomyces chisholmiae TaxID=3075540 RepID=A0ABU2JS87_9ACTN|nr:3-oxoacyl-[acyl-carrier-protein] synthase III C-terminal domain-containing protein [Streptomyces sp. DSM 44915]MDT0267379.1 3-oxoacyl-[acyl-carrier-protein] synthase III C-terminal domain-containing protein [Streptomyces sp. DSM 44915]
MSGTTHGAPGPAAPRGRPPGAAPPDPAGRLVNVGLSRVAVALPGHSEAVDDILARAGCGPLERRMFARVYGLRTSPTLATDERMEELLAQAGAAALDGGTASLVLYGHTLLMAEGDLGDDFPDRLRHRLGLPASPLYGVSHVNCASVLRCVDLARRYLRRPDARPDDRVLVLGGDQGSVNDAARYIPGTTVSGDTAVGVVVQRSGPAGLAGYRYRYLAGAGARDARFHRNMRMTPDEVARFSRVCAELTTDTVRRAVAAAGLTPERLDWVMPHLSNRMFWRTFSAHTGIPTDRICLDLIAERGHNFGGDALMALEHADRTGRLRPGDRCALVAIGQGAYTQVAIVEVVADDLETTEGAR